MFIDGLKIVQDFEPGLIPESYRERYIRLDTQTGQLTSDVYERSHLFRHEGSYSSSVSIRVRAGRVEVKGNPSRFDRLDNLFGYSSIEHCVAVYNAILSSLNFPNFSKCTKTYFLQSRDGEKAQLTSDGAIIQEIHITSNKSVGNGNEELYLKGLATQRYRNSIPHLHTNGCTVDWSSKLGNNRLIYPSVYKKSNEIELHLLPKIKRHYGTHSKEYRYVLDLIKYCAEQGVVRFEQKIKSEYLRRNNLSFYGLQDTNHFHQLHKDYLNLDNRLQVNNMKPKNIAETLIEKNICKTVRSANTTMVYYVQWMHGAKMDLSKTQVQIHRARLRKIGFDIGAPCDLTKVSPIIIKDAQEIVVSDLSIPSWYKKPVPPLTLVA